MGARTALRLADRQLPDRGSVPGPAARHRPKPSVCGSAVKNQTSASWLPVARLIEKSPPSLSLSRKTVERHVSNILAKFGARNRAELGTVIASQQDGR